MWLLEKMSVLLTEAVLVKFSFVGIHSSGVVYTIFRFRHLHNLSLGMSSFCKKCIGNMSGDDCLVADTIRKRRPSSRRTFKPSKVLLLFSMNTFFTEFHKTFIVPVLKWISKIVSSRGGFQTRSPRPAWLVGWKEIIWWMFGLDQSAHVTTACTAYMDIFNHVYQSVSTSVYTKSI